MLIVDAQVHVWGPGTPEHPLRGKPHRPMPYTPTDLLRDMTAAGVDKAVLVPPTWQGYYNDIALKAAREHSDKFAIMGRLDIAAPRAVAALANWRQQPGMLGLRLARDQQLPMDGSIDTVLVAAQDHGLPLMLNVTTSQLQPVERVAQRFPKLKLAIDHFGVPKGTKDEEAFADLGNLLALAKYPNIGVKATSLPTYTTDNYPFRRIHPYIRRAYDAFGPQRLFWGTDVTKMPCPYRQAVTLFTEEMPWLSEVDKEWIMGRAICEWLGWK